MALLDSLSDKAVWKYLSPTHVRVLAHMRLSALVVREIPRSRQRLEELRKRYPSAGPRELVQRLTDSKKSLAGTFGGIGGLFGIFSVPADLVIVAWLQLVLLVDVATLFKVNLKSEATRKELLDLYGYIAGVGPMGRSTPKVLGKVAQAFFQRSGYKLLGRAVPLLSSPLSAYLNSMHLQKVADEALRHYEGFGKAHKKTQAAAESEAPRAGTV